MVAQPKINTNTEDQFDPEQGVYRDFHYEQFILAHVAKELVGFEPEISLDALDLHSALRSQVRPGTKDGVLPHLVQRYVMMRREGLLPPPGIVRDLGNGRYELLDARQRVESAKFLGVKTMPFYVLQTDDEQILWQIAVAANNELNGEPPSQEDVEKQILAYSMQFPSASAVQMALLFKVNEYFVKAVLTQAKVSDRLTALGFKMPADHPDDQDAKHFVPGTLKRLASIQNDKVLVAAASLVRDAGLRTAEVNTLVSEVNSIRSGEADQIKAIVAKRTNGLGPRINKLRNGGELPPPEHPVQTRLMARAERLARDLVRFKSAAEAEMTDPEAAARFWGYIVTIEASAKRIVGGVIKTTK